MTTAAPRGTGVGTVAVIRHLDATGSAELDAAPVGELLAHLATVPDLARIDVYPDITRKTWGFPSGVSTTSTGVDPLVYPMAVPDVACGFLVVATGICAPLFTTHVLPMAQLCIDNDLLPLEMIEQGLFGLPLSHPLVSEFLSLTACAVHWGHANRQLVADLILDLLTTHAPPATQPARLIRHVGHCSYQLHPTAHSASVITNRGIQPLTTHRRGRPAPAAPTLITGGSHTHAYLVRPGPRAGEHGNRCPHGTPQWSPVYTPADITTSPLTQPDWARIAAVAANTHPDPAYQRRHLLNLEATITAVTQLGIATPVARLAPLVNYREPRHD